MRVLNLGETFDRLTALINYCVLCGATTTRRIPDGDALLRAVCTACGHIHYENPRLIVGCVATLGERVLLCRRAIEPRYGLWTLPAGFMENGETTAEGAARETREEAGAQVSALSPFAMVSVAHINQVHLFYRGVLISPELDPGEESLEARLFMPDDIPWSDLAFNSVRFCLERFLADSVRGHFGFHEDSLDPLYRTQSSREN